MNVRWAGLSLIAAATLFWVSWLLMPGVGITDAALILEIVAPRRSEVFVSSVLQLISAALYVPALLGIVVHPKLHARRGVLASAGLVLLGAMGSAADAVYHLLAFAMTAPNVDSSAMVPVMEYMQGPGLRLILPFVAAYFIGAYAMTRTLGTNGFASKRIAWIYPGAVAAAFAGAALANATAVTGRHVGLFVLFLVSAAQVWLGASIARSDRPRTQ